MKIFGPKLEISVIISTVIIVIILLLAPFKVPFNIESYGKMGSAKEWFLVKGSDGRLMSSLVNHKTGLYDNFRVTQFERGDAIEFRMKKWVISGAAVNKSDTVANIYSNETEKKIVKLKGDLETERAQLKVSTGMEKQSVIDEEKRKLEYARRQLEEQKKLFARDKKLVDKELISQEDYEISMGAVELFRINVSIAEERLKNATTGAKSEQINLVKSKIAALENEIDILNNRFSQFNLLSPLSGIVQRSISGDTLLVINDTTEYLVVIPLELKQINHVRPGQDVSIVLDNFNLELSGTVFSIDGEIRFIEGKQFFLIFVEVKRKVKFPMQGLRVSCKIKCDEILPRDYVQRLFTGSFN